MQTELTEDKIVPVTLNEITHHA